MGATKLRTLGLPLLLVAGTFLACNRVGDEYCDVGTDLTDQTDQCPFGPPGGPGSHSDACPDIPVDKTAPACAGQSWVTLWNSQLRDSCSNGGCHDAGNGTGADGIYLPYNDALTGFATLKKYKPVNYPYLSDDPAEVTHTWILCNLQRLKSGRSGMPPSTPLPMATLNAVQTWAQCGEPPGTGGPPPPPPPDAGSDATTD